MDMLEKSPVFIGVTGHKKSGKTTLIELLANNLTKRGFTIGAMKYTTHEVEFDTPGKDTFRHRQAGAIITLIKSASGQAIFADRECFDENQIKLIFACCDFVFVEGDSQSDLPKIYVADSRPPRDDIAGEIIAVWGSENMMDTKIQHFHQKQIDELGEHIINWAKKRNLDR
jgi:molybdopterin-guanine dinucleotide biosynthesis protein B